MDAAALRKHDLALFEDRLILGARAPITSAERAAVEARCAGALPPGLLALWNTSFGGQVDYGLSVEFDGAVHEFSFTELFYPGSDHYYDLPGWMDHEAALLEEALAKGGKPWDGKLTHLPFGGFEYLERLYVCVEAGPDYGAVYAYAAGLPPAWTLNLHQDSVARIADDIPGLFRMLDLASDPTAAADDELAAGAEIAAAIEELEDKDPELAGALAAMVRSTVVDWRAALDGGTLARRPRHRRLALEHASRAGDINLLAQLRDVGCDLDERFLGGGAALDHVLAAGNVEAARWLVEQGVSVATAVANGASNAPADLIADLLARGASPSGSAAAAAARAGNMQGARLVSDALARVDAGAVRQLVTDLAHWAGGAEASAQRIEDGSLISNVSAETYRHEGDRMRALRNHCQSLLGPEPKRTAKAPFWQRLFRP